ncbi:MAG: VWA domain-containing protein [Spirochaetales bacterium]|nr:VWA domain-containing protein [Spirochaetales bacterium]
MKIAAINFFIALFIILAPGMAAADGFIVVPDSPLPVTTTTGHFPLEVRFHHVDVEINGRTAVTKVDQEFYNPSQYLLEGEYIFPIPKGAVINSFSMNINGQEVRAELLDADKARQIYEDIVRKRLDPALLEYRELSVFKARVFPIEPRSSKRVKLSYTEILSKDSGTVSYLYPLNTEKFSAKALDSVRVMVTVKSSESIKSMYSTSHNVDVVRKSNTHVIASYEDENVKPDTDFRLYYTLSKDDIGVSLLTYRENHGDGYFFLDICPDFEYSAPVAKDITFVLDVSGSMKGEKLTQAKRALKYCLSKLNSDDRFELIRFSTEAYALWGSLKKADSTNLEQAVSFVEKLEAIGGTNMEEALKLALTSQGHTASGQTRPHMVIFITDGRPTIGEIEEQKLLDKLKQANSSATRIFTFGVGYEINTHLLDKITDLTRAYRTYISPKENIETEIALFYEKVGSPVLTDIELSFPHWLGVSHTYPKISELPDLFKGSSLTLLGRYHGSGKVTVTLKGRLNNSSKQYTYTLQFPDVNEDNTFIPPIWAARRIGMLLDQIRLYGENEELKEEIIMLARMHGIITPYTSMLILEDEDDRTARNELDDEYQTLGNIAKRSLEIEDKSVEEYEKLKEDSGAGGVQASEELQQLNKAGNSAHTKEGIDRLNFKDRDGTYQDMEAQIKNVQGRAFYNSGENWIDSNLQLKTDLPVERIQFASKKYFELLKNNTEAAQILALGRNIQFVMNNRIYEIYEATNHQ